MNAEEIEHLKQEINEGIKKDLKEGVLKEPKEELTPSISLESDEKETKRKPHKFPILQRANPMISLTFLIIVC